MRFIGLVALMALWVGCSAAEQDTPFPADTVRGEPTATIGQLDGPLEYLFGRVVGVAVDSRGVTYVADAAASTVRAYDSDGVFLSTIGFEGDGPGEFRYLLGVDINDRGELVVRGAFRLSVFQMPADGVVANSLVRTVPIDGPNPDRDVRGRLVGFTFYAPTYFWEGFQRRGYFYLVYDSLGAVTDTVFVPPLRDPESTGVANYPVNSQGFGRNVEGINRAPFEPRPRWDITEEGHVLFAAGDPYVVVEVSPQGDTLRVIRRAVAPRAIPEAEHRDSARAFGARLDSLPVPISEVRGMSAMARARQLPETLPPILGIQAGAQGETWVRRWPRNGIDETLFDVFDSSGNPSRVVVIPAALKSVPAPWLSNGIVAGVTTDLATGVDQVAIFRLVR